ncbi:MAG: DUF1549 and DUF1553 domain-containing protein [Planctomycetaceae bacterium]
MGRRTRKMLPLPALFAVCAWAVSGQPLDAAEKSAGLGDRGLLESLRLEPDAAGKGVTIGSRDARQQLFLTGVYSSGQLHDHTRQAKLTAEPAGVVEIDATGLVTPLADGKAVVKAVHDGKAAELPVTVEGFANPQPINFGNQIVPIFTKLGCNGGGCHGKASGQNGFKLSLLGFYPEDDYEFLVKEARGRRVFLASPDESLLLTKPTGRSPHGGGKRMDVDSNEYRLIRRWIEQGMPYGREDDPVVTGIQCLPEGRVMDRSGEQQVSVLATYSDGTVEDVTRMALFEPNDTEMAEVSVTGLVDTLDLAGEVAIMARYQGQVSTFRATVPLGAEVAKLPPEKNFVDQAVFAKLKLLGVPPSELCDDATFIRRVSLDIAGRIPTAEEVGAFLADTAADKREKLVDKLLDSPEYADYFANKWNLVLRNKKNRNAQSGGTYAFYEWIWSSIYDNKPYDQFVREILTASGDETSSPPVVWFRQVAQTEEQVEDAAQLFLGMRIQCARCHHHPFEKWSQDDYYGLAAFFSRIGKKNKPGENRSDVQRIFHNEGKATAKNPRSNADLVPVGLGGAPMDIPADRDPRHYLADWMAAKDNPFFAHSLANRYWKHFFSRGIVEPEDDMRATNPPTNPELLDALAARFIESGFDMKDLIRSICNSSTYQLSSLPNDFNVRDKQNFSRYYPKRLPAEVLYDAFHQVTGTSENFNGLPAGTTAVQLPDPTLGPYFLKVFGQPQGDTACECERSPDANLAQSLHLLNSNEVQTKVSQGRAARFASDKSRTPEDKIRELYLWAYSRPPSEEELGIATAHIAKHEAEPKVAYEDIVWALVNTKEFLFNH